MSAYYDLLEKPDIRQTGEQQPSCATALLMAGQWNLANLAISPLR